MDKNDQFQEIAIDSPEDLIKRINYKESLDFSDESVRTLKSVIAQYIFSDKNLYPCGISSCRTKHLKGFLVETSDGLETNIGNRCGKTHLGLEFEQERNKFIKAQKRYRNKQKLKDFNSEIPDYLKVLDQYIEVAKKFITFSQKLDARVTEQLRNMSRDRRTLIINEKELKYSDAEVLHEKLGIRSSVKDWIKNDKPTVSDLQIEIFGAQSITTNFRTILITNLKKPLILLKDAIDQNIDDLSDTLLNNHVTFINGLPNEMEFIKARIKDAADLMSTDTNIFKYLPGQY